MMKLKALLILFFGIIFFDAQAQSVLDLGKAKQEITLAGKTEGEMTVEELLNAKGLETSDSTHRINGFGMTVSEIPWDTTKKTMMVYSLVAMGNELSKEMQRVIKSLAPGSSISIADIHCYPKYKAWHYCNTLYFKIK